MAKDKKLQTNQEVEKEQENGSPFSDFWVPISAAIAVRAVCASYSDLFEERVELTSVVYSFEKLKDSIAMVDDGLNPFEAKNMHFPPLTLHLFRFLLNTAPTMILPLFISIDVATTWILSSAADVVWRQTHGSSSIRKLIFSLYAFNPITIVSTGILSLTVIQNFVSAVILLSLVTDRPTICAILIGAWSSFTIYPFILISCLVFRSNGSIVKFLSLVLVSALTTITFVGINYLLNNQSLNFLGPVYASILNFSSIQPNSGLYWYFFVQIFEHFRSFYTMSFVVLYFFMPIPITFLIRKDTILHFTIIGFLVSIFFPYPTLNQVSLLLAFLPVHDVYKKHFRYTILIAGTIVSTVFLMPVMWHMWIVSSSGNANFFFGTTIVYNVALINLVMDMIFVYSRRQIDLEYSDALKKNTKMDFAFY
ncbi:GPI transamidase component GAB1 [Caenorhabditis elegans]|uniref:GPI transamidase component GAB1 n=1 Tax=Caenorhabditis elegans TaxID=6239 RepID=Q22672_CAEEL|nr:GPI transamidase component GAB1 [Caenorhabditis elegans]CAA99928.2 GPI transamidase component GAB1 [Caenorhabditis elegans]|eukprot:NP_492189.2 Uncharacterized protein CELE_T22C1.3 [Caenorhabditis elegans]